MTLYRDTDSGEVITESQLHGEYLQAIAAGTVEECTFGECSTNCLVSFGGTLEIITARPGRKE